MARVTVEDCVMRVPNRFELVLVAGQRARSIASGAAITLDRDNDKNPVVALREIAEATISIEGLRNALVTGLQKQPDVDEPEEETEFSMTEGVWPQAGVVGGEDELGEGMHYTDADGADLDAEIEVDEPGVEPAEDDL